MAHYANLNGGPVFIHETDTSRASLCCGYAVRLFGNGAECCESCGRRCKSEEAPERGAPSIDGEAS